jgi:glutamate synthase domain-containing protein 1
MRAQSRLRRGMAEANGSTIDALRVITEKLEKLTSSMTSHERTLKELEQVHVAELFLLSEKVEKVSSEQAKRHEDEVARQESHGRTSCRGMHSRSRSSQSTERKRHATTGN